MISFSLLFFKTIKVALSHFKYLLELIFIFVKKSQDLLIKNILFIANGKIRVLFCKYLEFQ